MSNELTISTSGRISSTEMIMNDGNLDKIKAYSSLMSGSNMVPDHFKGNTYDCAIVVAKALSMGVDPVAMSQEVFPVNGKMTYGSKLIIAMIHNCGMLVPRTFVKTIGEWDQKGRLINGTFERENGLGLQVGFKFIGDDQPTWGSVLLLEDQTNRNSPLWKTDPQQQLTYLASKRWSSIHLPGVTMGMIGADEMQDSEPKQQMPERDITPINKTPVGLAAGQVVDFNACADSESEVVINSRKQKERVEKTLKEEVNAENYDPQQEQDGIIEGKKLTDISVEIDGAEVKNATKVDTPSVNANNPGNLPDSPLGVKFDSRYMTGSILANKEFRLSKAGKEHFASLESKEKEQANNDQWVVAVNDMSIEMLGTEHPIKVELINNDGTVKLVGFDDFYPMVDAEDGTIYLEFTGTQTKQDEPNKYSGDLEILRAQIDKCKTGIDGIIQKAGLELTLDQTSKFNALNYTAIESYTDIEKLGSELVDSDLDEVKDSNKKYWDSAKELIQEIVASGQDENDPFA